MTDIKKANIKQPIKDPIKESVKESVKEVIVNKENILQKPITQVDLIKAEREYSLKSSE